MNRPSQKLARLLEKIARKESRTPGKAGKRIKQWRKWVAAYRPIATDLPNNTAS